MTSPLDATVAAGPRTLVDTVLPALSRSAAGSLARAALLVVGGAALTAVAAQLAFHVPWTPVPYTGQTAAVLLVGTALGWRLGALSMALYVLVGAAGLPVFSGGAYGVEQLLGYTGGYLVGFIAAAAVVGRLAEREWDRSPASAGLLMAGGNLLIYAVGVPVLAWVLGMPLVDAIRDGALVFLPWDAAKVLLAAGLLPAAWHLAGRRT